MSANSQNFAAAVVPQLALAVTTGAATTNGTAIDLLTAPASEEVGFVGMYTTLGTSALFKIQDSADNSSWADVAGAASPALTAIGAYALSVGKARVRRYVRLVATTVGAASVVSGIFTPFQLDVAPATGKVNGTDYTVLGN